MLATHKSTSGDLTSLLSFSLTHPTACWASSFGIAHRYLRPHAPQKDIKHFPKTQLHLGPSVYFLYFISGISLHMIYQARNSGASFPSSTHPNQSFKFCGFYSMNISQSWPLFSPLLRVVLELCNISLRFYFISQVCFPCCWQVFQSPIQAVQWLCEPTFPKAYSLHPSLTGCEKWNCGLKSLLENLYTILLSS